MPKNKATEPIYLKAFAEAVEIGGVKLYYFQLFLYFYLRNYLYCSKEML